MGRDGDGDGDGVKKKRGATGVVTGALRVKRGFMDAGRVCLL